MNPRTLEVSMKMLLSSYLLRNCSPLSHFVPQHTCIVTTMKVICRFRRDDV